LYNLSEDIAERINLAEQEPELVKSLLNDFHGWQGEMISPLWVSHPKWKQHSRRRYNQVYVDSLKKK